VPAAHSRTSRRPSWIITHQLEAQRLQIVGEPGGIETENKRFATHPDPRLPAARLREGHRSIESAAMYITENHVAPGRQEASQNAEIFMHSRGRQIADHAFPDHQRRNVFVEAGPDQRVVQVVFFKIDRHEVNPFRQSP
jgi:hypothetical protein